MTLNPLTAELASEHRRDLLRDAEAYRRAGTSRHRGGRATRLTMRLRLVHLKDTPLVAATFAGVCTPTGPNRFQHRETRPGTGAERQWPPPDCRGGEALVAVTRPRGQVVGLAQFVRNCDDPTAAAVTITVVDAWRGRRVGSMLATRLARRAARRGVTHLTVLMPSYDVRSRPLLDRLGEVGVVARDAAFVTYRVTLPGRQPAWLRRRIAAAAPQPVTSGWA